MHAQSGLSRTSGRSQSARCHGRWWRGDVSFIAAQRTGLSIDGPRPLARAFPDWFDRYQFADIEPAA